jgi:hypothetical protein
MDRWVRSHAKGTFAGMYLQGARRDGYYVIGFTRRQSARIREIHRWNGLCAPGRFVGFSKPPKYSLLRLEGLGDRILTAAWRGGYGNLVNSTGEDIKANLVTVGTEHVKQLRALLIKRFGRHEPFRVQYEEAAVEL